tara:strand:+ start:2031 stop:2249 length:219 start_codon:yes stop_codon:yes gene_type:complete
MGVVSVRFNKEEEKIIKKLSDHFHADKSALIKKSLYELYENMEDISIIKKYEAKEKKGKVAFFTADKILTHD